MFDDLGYLLNFSGRKEKAECWSFSYNVEGGEHQSSCHFLFCSFIFLNTWLPPVNGYILQGTAMKRVKKETLVKGRQATYISHKAWYLCNLKRGLF